MMLRRVGLLEKIVMNFKFAVIGGGAWGTAIANLLARLNNSTVIIWAKEKEVVNEINSQHKNSLFLEGIELEKNIYATDNISEAIAPFISVSYTHLTLPTILLV